MTARYPVSVSGRKWFDQNGAVFLLKTCSSWSLAENLTAAEMDTYLTAVAALGFNAVTVSLPGHRGPANEGGWSYLDPDYNNQNFWTGNEWDSGLGDGWAAYDYLLTKADDLGLVVVLSLYCGFSSGTGSPPTGQEGIGPLLEYLYNNVHSSSATWMYTIGQAVGTRFNSHDNIVWHLGADKEWFHSTAAIAEPVDQFFGGVQNTEGGKSRRFRVAEPNNDAASSAVNQWDNAFSYLTPFSADSVYHWTVNAVDVFENVWTNLSGGLPVWDCEPPYVDNDAAYTGTDSQQRRERIYSTFFRGGIGMNWGDESIYGFDQGDYFGTTTWADAIDNQPILEAGHAWSLLDSVCKDVTFAPDAGTFLTTGIGSGDTKAASGLSTSAAVAYFPSSRTVVVDTTILFGSGNVKLRWYDPTLGTFSTIAASEAQNASRSVTYNAGTHSDGAADWVLVAELVDGIPAPTPIRFVR